MRSFSQAHKVTCTHSEVDTAVFAIYSLAQGVDADNTTVEVIVQPLCVCQSALQLSTACADVLEQHEEVSAVRGTRWCAPLHVSVAQ